MKFSASRRKVERAMKHIHDLNELLVTFSQSDFYTVSVEEYKGSNHVRIDIDKSGFSIIDAALSVGDALHNLRSALDMLYYQAMHEATGLTDQWTRFPYRSATARRLDWRSDRQRPPALAAWLGTWSARSFRRCALWASGKAPGRFQCGRQIPIL